MPRKQVKEREKKWVTNFQLMCSKDNEVLPKYHREFFDSPLRYDVQGNRLYLFLCGLGSKTDNQYDGPVSRMSGTKLLPTYTQSSIELNVGWRTVIKNSGHQISKARNHDRILKLLQRIPEAEGAEVKYCQANICS